MASDPIFEAEVKRLDTKRDIFERLYFGERIGLHATAFRMGIRMSLLLSWIRRRKIEIRSVEEAYETRKARNETAREMVRMRLVHRMTVQEIADQLGATKGGVQQMLKRRGLSGKLDTLPTHEEYEKFQGQERQEQEWQERKPSQEKTKRREDTD